MSLVRILFSVCSTYGDGIARIRMSDALMTLLMLAENVILDVSNLAFVKYPGFLPVAWNSLIANCLRIYQLICS